MKVVWQHHTSQKATFESPVWMKMLRRSVKDAGILSGLVYGGRSRNLWERLNFHPPEQSREVSHILPNFIQSWHNASRKTFCPRDLLQSLLQRAIPHTFDRGPLFRNFPPHCQWRLISDHIGSAYSHTSLDWYGPLPSHGSSSTLGSECGLRGKARHYELPPALGHSLRRCPSRELC